ncbi:MAG: dihydrofolate reductase family protein [Gemmatimonadota bacterium]|nr:dihydrofolate reductase family protein [Gemmatimonadota bacterium]
MARLSVFNTVSLDGYFTDAANDMSWAHADSNDAEWNAFVQGNASSGNSTLVYGRVTYEMMAGYWPSPMAAKAMPELAQRMNGLPKIVFSNSLVNATWANTTLIGGEAVEQMAEMKSGAGPNMTILGSGKLIASFAQAGLIDAYQLVVKPVVLGRGRTIFEGVTGRPTFAPTASRTFGNGNVLLTYMIG